MISEFLLKFGKEIYTQREKQTYRKIVEFTFGSQKKKLKKINKTNSLATYHKLNLILGNRESCTPCLLSSWHRIGRSQLPSKNILIGDTCAWSIWVIFYLYLGPGWWKKEQFAFPRLSDPITPPWISWWNLGNPFRALSSVRTSYRSPQFLSLLLSLHKGVGCYQQKP